jgi:hypothetical protein
VFYCGFNSEDSFGANAFLAVRPEGNLLIDSPRFTTPLVREIERRGGLSHVLLTHRDDVADADRFAGHFGAEVWIHEADRAARALRDAGLPRDRGHRDPARSRRHPLARTHAGQRGLPPGVALPLSGDSLYWSRRRQDLGAFP